MLLECLPSLLPVVIRGCTCPRDYVLGLGTGTGGLRTSCRAPLPIGRTGCLWPSATHEGLLSENKAVGFRATCGLGQILENCLIPAKTEVNGNVEDQPGRPPPPCERIANGVPGASPPSLIKAFLRWSCLTQCWLYNEREACDSGQPTSGTSVCLDPCSWHQLLLA